MRRAATVALAAAAATGLAAPAAEARPRGPVVEHMVVFRDGTATAKKARAVARRIGRRRHCAVGRGTPLAALLRARPAHRIGIKDFGSCSLNPADAGGLFVRRIGADGNSGQNGWVYKVGRKLATAGAADPGGPFGRGRLQTGRRVTWFYCTLTAGQCQSTLALRLSAPGGGLLNARVLAYDDEGRGSFVSGATVTIGGVSRVSGPAGLVQFTLPAGRYRIKATKPGLVRTYPQRVRVR